MADTETSILAALKTLQAADPRLLERCGFRLEPLSYYSPLNQLQFLEDNQDLWSAPSVPLDIDWRVDHQLEVAKEVSRYIHELADIPDHAGSGSEFYWQNNFWNSADALVQYGLLRSRKPSAVIEVGCGFSSLLAARALRKNSEENRELTTNVTLIEPNPRRELLDKLPRDWRLVESILQRCPFEWFGRLGPGDLLFYDGSHCCHTASDVNWFFFQVLPRLREGVLIHVHDIFFPSDYPREWLFERLQSWNEQFLLQAFLMNNSAYRVEIANAFIAREREAQMKALYGAIQPFWGASFWMTKGAS
jgi:predicted O-methyltransferase YrrM